jgi:tetratricopeptide (TPR) repeat protein
MTSARSRPYSEYPTPSAWIVSWMRIRSLALAGWAASTTIRPLRRSARVFDEALGAFRALGSEAFVQETEARRAECLVLAGRFQEALEILPGAIEAAEETPQLGAFLERLYGYALVQTRQADEARPHLELARGLEAEYEGALTLEALARTRLGAPEADAESKEMLARLGVLATPLVPLP